MPAPPLAEMHRIYGREQYDGEYKFVIDYGVYGAPVIVQHYSMN